jgi:hypothetical protein
MFDCERWRVWLADQVILQRDAGYLAEVSVGKSSPKQGYSFRLRTQESIAELRIWKTGEADWDVMDARSGDFVDHRWDIT